MALLKAKSGTEKNNDRATLRIFPVTAKLTKDERKAVTDFACSQGLARGQWMRDAILAALPGRPANNASLAEVLGIRLLLVNVLRPLAAGQKLTPEAFDKLLDEISTAKHELAGKLASEKRR
ncbi:MAG TPA: hypothetical protein VHX20_02460 [Terracidiphilus sp.]|jgi:hypothetical protein|nr:hypothetical protein [Terracidiphilus sp.]